MKNDVSQKLFEYNNEIRQNEFYHACEQARKNFCVFRTRFFYKNKLIQIIDEYDPSIRIISYIDIEKEQKSIDRMLTINDFLIKDRMKIL